MITKCRGTSIDRVLRLDRDKCRDTSRDLDGEKVPRYDRDIVRDTNRGTSQDMERDTARDMGHDTSLRKRN